MSRLSRLWVLTLVLAAGLLLAACTCNGGTKTPTPTPTRTPNATATASPTPANQTLTRTPMPTQTSAATPAATPSSTATPAATPSGGTPDASAEIRDYLAVTFPPGPGRDDIFYICVNCHGIQVIVVGAGNDANGWEAARARHDLGTFTWARPDWEGRQASQDALWQYLLDHLGPDHPPFPPMPEALVAGWQVY